uniref:AbrB family transcriptional regulator n=1 Tax=Ignisphaera aggregans TaxID=334771 RepID=A0A7J2TAV3_9CREN
MEITVLTKATPRSNSLRTTVPSSIVKLFDLKEGDKLRWDVRVEHNKLIVVVEPLKVGRNGEK